MQLMILGQNDGPCEDCNGGPLDCLNCPHRPTDLKTENNRSVWPYTLGALGFFAGVFLILL
jgi:hypothetical protein